jgi:hypothetical protein
VVPGNNFDQQARQRALALAERYPAAREALEFYARILNFGGDWAGLRALVVSHGPALLRETAARMTEFDLKSAVDGYLRGDDRRSPASFFARVMLRRDPPRAGHAHANQCPRCGEPPLCGCLRKEADGSAFLLVCSLCGTEWRFPRGQCPACGGKVEWHVAEGMDHILTQACTHCARYLHVIRVDLEPDAIPEVDEIAAIAMDIWALERGWEKIHPNWIGL